MYSDWSDSGQAETGAEVNSSGRSQGLPGAGVEYPTTLHPKSYQLQPSAPNFQVPSQMQCPAMMPTTFDEPTRA
jgi:hypothetical protein